MIFLMGEKQIKNRILQGLFNWFQYELMLLCAQTVLGIMKQVDDNQGLPSPQKEP